MVRKMIQSQKRVSRLLPSMSSILNSFKRNYTAISKNTEKLFNGIPQDKNRCLPPISAGFRQVQ